MKQELESLLAGTVLAEPVEVAAVAPAVAAPAVMPGPDFTTKIPSRDPQAGPDQIDLAPYYNASLKQGWIPPLTPVRLTENCFVQMPQGLLRFRGVPFEVRGLIQLAGQRLNERGGGFPTQVTGIQIGRAGSRLHVLHATAWSSEPGEVVARYVVHYAGGEAQDIPVRFGSDIANWQPAP